MVSPGALGSGRKQPSRLSRLAVGLAAVAGLSLGLLPLTEGAVLLAGALLLVAASIRPAICLYLAAFAVPFGALRTVSFGGLPAGGVDLAAALLFVAWLASGVANRRLRLVLPALFWPLVLLLVALSLSLFDTVNLSASAKELAKWVEILIVYTIGASLLTSERQARWLVVAMLAAGSLEALSGAYGSLMRLGPPSYAILGGAIFRASGEFAQPNPFAGYMNHLWPLAGGLLLALTLSGRSDPDTTTHDSRSQARWLTVPLVVAGGLTLAGLVLSWSRGAWLGAAAAVAAMLVAWAGSLLWSTRRSDRLAGRRAVAGLIVAAVLAAAVGVLGAADLLPESITGRLGSIVDDIVVIQDVKTIKVNDANFSAVERVAHWWAGWRMWEDHPWTGVGIGNYATAYPDYNLPGWEDPLGHAHNFYINMGAEAGTLGLAAYLIFLITAVALDIRRLRSAGGWWQRGIAVGVAGMLAARLVQDGLDNLWVHGIGVQVALTLLLLETGRRPEVPADSLPGSSDD